MRFSLLPQTSRFYDLFAEAGANASEAARLIEGRFRDFPEAEVSHAAVKALEHEGDRLTHEIITLLNTQYVTPFDREDIYALAGAIDDVVDHIERSSELLELYKVEAGTDQAAAQCQVLVEAAQCLEGGLSRLKGLSGAAPYLAQVRELEDEGDRITREAIASLFDRPQIDPLVVIRWKDIFEALEDAIDACETAANLMGNIVVKNS